MTLVNVYWSKRTVAFGLGSLNKMAGWYVQCRYGARVITADGTNNAVFVKSLADVLGVLDALLNAAAAGELDTCHYPSGRAQTRSQTRRCQSCSTCLTLTQLK